MVLIRQIPREWLGSLRTLRAADAMGLNLTNSLLLPPTPALKGPGAAPIGAAGPSTDRLCRSACDTPAHPMPIQVAMPRPPSLIVHQLKHWQGTPRRAKTPAAQIWRGGSMPEALVCNQRRRCARGRAGGQRNMVGQQACGASGAVRVRYAAAKTLRIALSITERASAAGNRHTRARV